MVDGQLISSNHGYKRNRVERKRVPPSQGKRVVRERERDLQRVATRRQQLIGPG
ncbi:hypothetical protein ACLOJK_040451, partial [Asimina triloba]